jgi:hypothetical protein
MNAPIPLELVRSTANPSPLRPPASIRRTSSIDVEWPEGAQGPRLLHGRARDTLTPATGGPGRDLAAASLTATIASDRTITALAADPAPARLQELVGERGGGHLRMVMGQTLPDLIAAGAPLYLLLDDISGVSLVSAWAWSLWNPSFMAEVMGVPDKELRSAMLADRAGVCWGLQLGNSGMSPDRTGMTGIAAEGGDLRNPADPEGWHAFPEIAGVSMRRARRIDIWRDGALIRIDSAFQDSAPRPAGGRAALHEYRLTATVDAASLELLSLTPEPRVLPFVECPGAVTNAIALVGTPLPAIRAKVLSDLRGPAGCTHLNDALRALAEVPMLAAKLAEG